MTNHILEWALAWADAGFRVAPLPKGKKKGGAWKKKATSDEHTIRRWFDRNEPGNYLIVIDHPYVCLDFDNKPDTPGADFWDEHGEEYEETFEAETQGGGYHVIYELPEGTRARQCNIVIDGVHLGEIKAAGGGYIVGPGSSYIDADGERFYRADIDDLEAGFGVLPEFFCDMVRIDVAGASNSEHKNKPVTERHRRELLRIENAGQGVDYDTWVKVGMACRHEFGDNGLGLFMDWSSGSDKHDAEYLLKKWPSFNAAKYGGQAATWGSVVHLGGGATGVEADAGAMAAIAERLEDAASVDDILETLWQRAPRPLKRNLPEVRRTQDGVPAAVQDATYANIKYIVDALGFKLRRNVVTRAEEARFGDNGLQALLEATGDPWGVMVRLVLDRAMLIGIKNSNEVRHILTEFLAPMDSYSPIEDWLEELEWDGSDHISALAATVTLAEGQSAKVWEAYLRRWLIQCVQAACGWRDPQQLAGVLVLSGPQGCYKTTWFGSFIPKGWYNEGVSLHSRGGKLSVDDKHEALAGAWVAELGELETTFGAASQGALKNFISATQDRYRLPFRKDTATYPRQTVFCGTVNHLQFLMDETGSRRYWPVEVERCDSAHSVSVEGIWAQAMELWDSGEQWHLTEEEDRARAEGAGVFNDRTTVEEWFEDFDEDYGGQPKDVWCVVTVTDAMELLPAAYGRSNMVLRQTRSALEKIYGRARKRTCPVSGRRRTSAWLVPDVARGKNAKRALDLVVDNVDILKD